MRKRNSERRCVILLCVAALVAFAGSVHAAKEIDEETFRELLQDGKVVECTIHGSTGEQVEVEGVMDTKSGRQDFHAEVTLTPDLAQRVAEQARRVTMVQSSSWGGTWLFWVLPVLPLILLAGFAFLLWMLIVGFWKGSSDEQG